MKLLFKILGVLIIVILLAMVAVPYFYKDQIVEKVKQEINNNVNATVDFTDFDLSLFRSFPNFDFRLEGLSVVNKAPFAGDTLAWIPEFRLTLDLMSVIRGEDYELRKITIMQPTVNALVAEDGAVNWDIAIQSEEATETTPEPEASESSPFVIQLRSVEILDGRIVYDDKSLATYALLEGVNHKLSGDFTLDFTNLNTYTAIRNLTVIYDGVKYLNKVDAELDATIGADLANAIYTLEDNELRLNNLFIGFDGSVGMQENGDINLMLTYASKKSDFSNFLSMIPAMYATDLEGLNTSGTLAITGNVKGIYNDESYPAFAFNLRVQDGFFQYPDLPQAVTDVNISTTIDYPGGDFDNMTIDVSKFEMALAGSRVSASLSVKKPMTDVDIKGAVNGKMDLSKVKEFYPLEDGDALSGRVTSNVSFEGKMLALQQEKYDEFTFLGSVLLEDLNYATSMLPQRVNIRKAQLNFSPEYLDLVNFSMNLGKSTFFAKGRIEQFMPYVLADGTLKGNLETTSTYLNLTDLMPADAGEASTEPDTELPAGNKADTISYGIIEIPANINFTLSADYHEVICDNIVLNNVKGVLLVKDQAVNLQNLNMGVLDGTVNVNGKYDTKNPAKPDAEMGINLQGINIKEAYNTFGALEKFAPIAQKTDGTFSTSFNLNTLLGQDLMPVYSSMNGGGSLNTSEITVENVNTINKLADALKMPDLKRLLLSPIKLSFEFIDGKLHVKPFDIKFQDMKANLGGWTSFDQTINYDMVMTVPRDKFGGDANALLDNLVSEANKMGTNFSLGDEVNLKAKITGTAADPKVSVLPGEGSGKNMVDDLKKKAQQELEKQKQKLEEEARKELEKKKAEARAEAVKIIADADAQANKIIADAQKQVDAINKTAQESAAKAKEEARKQADDLMAEAKKKGPIAEMAAKATTDKLLEEADKQADNIVKEADGKSEGIMSAARQQAATVKADAQKRADDLLE